MSFRITTILGILLVASFNLFAQKYPTPDSYLCYKTSSPIKVDGIIDEEDWSKAAWTNDFVDIEGDKMPNPAFKTRIKMLWDDDYLYIAAELEEPHLWSTILERDAIIYQDNDFEVFINTVPTSSIYYEFEMNLLNTVWDLMLTKPYRDGGHHMNSWDIDGLKTAVKMYGTLNDPSDTDDKWTLEIAFPLKVLSQENPYTSTPKEDTRWRINFSRVNWDLEEKDGEYIKTVNPETGKVLPEHNWVWSPQGEISMHMPEQWGYLQFTENVVGNKLDKDVKETEAERVHRQMYDIYYLQRAFYSKNKRYAKSLKELAWKDKIHFNGERITPELMRTVEGYTIELKIPQINKVYILRQDSSTDIIEMK